MKSATWILFTTMILSATLLSAQVFTRELRLTEPRMNGGDVTALQSRLLSYGYSSIGTADGWLGPLTDRSIRRYQEYTGFNGNGVVDRQLWETVFSSRDIVQKMNEDLKYVNSITVDRYIQTEKPVTGRSTEGGTVLEYRENRMVKYIEIILTGEIGKIHYKVYPVESRYVVLRVEYSYPAPFDIEHATTESTPYYYVADRTYIVKKGVPREVKYDEIKVLEMIKGN